jgi:hypothetical protein
MYSIRKKGKRNDVLCEYLKKIHNPKILFAAQKNKGNNSGILASYY